MKSIDELDYYELLEVAPRTPADEIDRAYRLAQQTYAEGSLAVYSVFASFDVEAIRARLDQAYRTLSDPASREAYDREFNFDRQASPAPQSAGTTALSGSEFEDMSPTSPTEAAPDESAFDAFDEIVEEFDALEEEGGGDYGGVRLRRTRLFRGFELDDITEVTKVSGNYLRNIEEENFEDLPADVYVRGFVTAYAKTIGLDPNVVVPGYMARVAQSRQGGRRGRFLGRD